MGACALHARDILPHSPAELSSGLTAAKDQISWHRALECVALESHFYNIQRVFYLLLIGFMSALCSGQVGASSSILADGKLASGE